MHLCLGKIKIRPQKKIGLDGDFFFETTKKKEMETEGQLESVRCMGKKKSANFSGEKAVFSPSGRSKNGDGFFSWLMGHKAESGVGFLLGILEEQKRSMQS